MSNGALQCENLQADVCGMTIVRSTLFPDSTFHDCEMSVSGVVTVEVTTSLFFTAPPTVQNTLEPLLLHKSG